MPQKGTYKTRQTLRGFAYGQIGEWKDAESRLIPYCRVRVSGAVVL